MFLRTCIKVILTNIYHLFIHLLKDARRFRTNGCRLDVDYYPFLGGCEGVYIIHEYVQQECTLRTFIQSGIIYMQFENKLNNVSTK